MAKEEPYDQPCLVSKLNLIFAISSLVLVVTVLAMVWDDYEREWKDYQRQFLNLEREKAQQDVQAALNAVDKQQREVLQKQLDDAKGRLDKQEAVLKAARSEMSRLDAELYKINQQYQFAKSIYDSAKYLYEAATLGHSSSKHDAAREERDMEEAKAELDRRDLALQDVTLRHKLHKAKIDGFEAEFTRLEAQRKELMGQVDRVELRLKAVSKPKLVEVLLNAPLLDFMQPTLRVQQVVLDKLENNINFMSVPRVDRCQTCHMGIDRPGFTGAKQPFAAHPRLNIFVSSNSPHPIENFGCTPCHKGRDRGTSFDGTAHTASSDEQGEDWNTRFGWHEMEHWDYPMLPKAHFEAACYVCHIKQVTKPEAPRLNEALTLIERSGCFGCHKINGFEQLRRVGPDLKRIRGKVAREWAFKWVKDPRAFNAHARMPKFFDLSNTGTPDFLARNNVEAQAIVEYLFNNSEEVRYAPPPVSGNAANGKQLTRDIGCLACHISPEEEVPQDRTSRRRFGPVLVNSGSKTTEGWLYHWLKNPKEYFPETYMPDLRLSDQEAADIAAYLMTKKSSAFESATVPVLDKRIRDDMAIEYLTRSLTIKEAKDRLASMDETARNNYVGEKMIGRYGCYGCHSIKGFEKSQPIGTELSDEGNKSPERLDFAYTDVERTLPAWLHQKFLDPRSYDAGLVKKPEEKLKMPNFNFSEEEAQLLITAILSFRDDRIDASRKRNLTPDEVAIEEGRRIIHIRNCQGCHVLDGTGGDIRATLQDVGFSPPPLDGEGRKVQSDWLYPFLKSPTTVRPWLKVRMPTFQLSDKEATTIARAFAYADKQEFPYQTFDYQATAANLTVGRQLFEMLRCMQCHIVGPIPEGKEAADMAPDLRLSRKRLRPQWILDWLKDPQALQEGTRMPTFFSEGVSPVQNIFEGKADRQIEAIRNHVLALGQAGAVTSSGGSGQR